MDFSERIKKAKEIKQEKQKEEALSDRAPSVEVAEIYRKIADILTDDDKEIFSQLDKAKLGNMFVDETKDFATAVDFALNPFPDIEMKYRSRGIIKKTKVAPKIVIENGIEIEKETFEYEPVTFEVKPLLTYSHEWLKKRHYVNRKRVQELIDLIRAIRMGDTLQPQRPASPIDVTKPPGRI